MNAPMCSAAVGTAHYYAELDALDRETARLNAAPGEGASKAEWDMWSNRTARLYHEIVALPPVPENIRLKARAVWSMSDGQAEEINVGNSLMGHLVRQIVIGLVSEGV